MPGAREQERCVEILQEVFGAAWGEEASRNFLHAAPGMAKGLVEALEAAGRTQELVAHYTSLLARPGRNPALLVRLAEHLENRTVPYPLPTPAQRAQCLLQLAVHLFRNSPGDALLTRTRARLSEILVEGNPPLLKRLLADVDLDGLRALASLIEGAVERDVDRLFTRIAIERSPDVFRGEERPFWEGPAIWTLQGGLRKQEEELRILREVKIPANAEAIGKAASYGDLSENSEWEAAIEDQRHLTSRAMELESEIRRAQLIEHAPIPNDVAAPGTSVRYRDQSGAHDIELVGPWDVERENQVSYRSPLGQGLLGLRAGGRARVELPNGWLEVEVLGIGPLTF
jgi:transcription elongation factor GreA